VKINNRKSFSNKIFILLKQWPLFLILEFKNLYRFAFVFSVWQGYFQTYLSNIY